MLDFHKKHNADATIAVLEVPLEEASRFGIMSVDENDVITEFAEKPKEPKSNLASMGVYIFSWKVLKQYLVANEKDENATKDFGKNIIPDMLADKCKMVAYHFSHYWKDVGTIDSLWEANMDCLDPNVPLNLYDNNWKIYSRNPVMPPHYAGPNSKIENSMVAEGCNIYGTVDFSILFSGVTVEEGAVVRDSIIMPNTVIKKDAVIEYSIVGEDCIIGEGSHIGERPETTIDKDKWGIAVVGHKVNISDNVEVKAKAMISESV